MEEYSRGRAPNYGGSLTLYMHVRLPRHRPSGSPWIDGLLSCLGHGQSFGLYDVGEHDEPSPGLEAFSRANQGCWIFADDARIYLDTWDFRHPTACLLDRKDLLVDCRLILKIQRRVDYEWRDRTDIPVLPWTMFHTAQMDWMTKLPYRFDLCASPAKRFRAGFSGRAWPVRRPWLDALSRLHAVDVQTWDGRERIGGNGAEGADVYVRRMATWEVSVVLQGKHDHATDGKNRREVECASLGIPMVLNYRPYYMDPLVPDMHYVFCPTPKDLDSCIEDARIRGSELSSAALRWWTRNASVEGVCQSFVRRMETQTC